MSTKNVGKRTTKKIKEINSLNSWNFSESNLLLFNQLIKLNSKIDEVLTNVFISLNKYDSSIIKFWENENLKVKVDSYLLRYVAPLFELSEEIGNYEDALIVQLLSCICWRTFDNCIDGHLNLDKSHLNSITSLLHLTAFIADRLDNKRDLLQSLGVYYKMMAKQSAVEKTQPINLENIWKRCSLFLFAAEKVLMMSKHKLGIYKKYINYSGLAHDIHDYSSDFSSNTQSLPVYWMKQINPDGVFSIHMTKFLYELIRKEIQPLECFFKKNDVIIKYPITNYLVHQSWKTFHEE